MLHNCNKSQPSRKEQTGIKKEKKRPWTRCLTLPLTGHVFNEQVPKAVTTRGLWGTDPGTLGHKDYINTKLYQAFFPLTSPTTFFPPNHHLQFPTPPFSLTVLYLPISFFFTFPTLCFSFLSAYFILLSEENSPIQLYLDNISSSPMLVTKIPFSSQEGC